MKSTVLIGVLLIILGYLVFRINWSSYWVIKTSCFNPTELHIKDVFSTEATSSWHRELPNNKDDELNWEGPSLYHFSGEQHLDLTRKGIAGYLIGRLDVDGAVPISPDLKVKIIGDVYILKSSIFVELMSNSKQSVFILGKVNDENRLISTLYMNEKLLNILNTSQCAQ